MAYFYGVSDDEFLMWRAVFAFALVDGTLSLEEQDILAGHLKNVPFSEEQLKTLREDMRSPQDVEVLCTAIQHPDNKTRFCELARTLVWSDGNIRQQEKEILKRVSCINDPYHQALLQESAHTQWMHEYTRRYENMGFSAMRKPHSLFEAMA